MQLTVCVFCSFERIKFNNLSSSNYVYWIFRWSAQRLCRRVVVCRSKFWTNFEKHCVPLDWCRHMNRSIFMYPVVSEFPVTNGEPIASIKMRQRFRLVVLLMISCFHFRSINYLNSAYIKMHISIWISFQQMQIKFVSGLVFFPVKDTPAILWYWLECGNTILYTHCPLLGQWPVLNKEHYSK